MPVWLLSGFLSFPKPSSSIFWILPFRETCHHPWTGQCLPASSTTPARPHVLSGGLSALAGQTCPQGSGPWLGRGVWPLPGRQAGPHPSPSSPCQPQLLTRPQAPRRPSPYCPQPVGAWGWKSGPAQPFSNERQPHRPLCGVLNLLTLPSCLPSAEHCPCHSCHKGPLFPFIFY